MPENTLSAPAAAPDKLSQDARVRSLQKKVAFGQRLRRAAAKDPSIKALIAARDDLAAKLALHKEKLAALADDLTKSQSDLAAAREENAALRAELAASKPAAPKKSAK